MNKNGKKHSMLLSKTGFYFGLLIRLSSLVVCSSAVFANDSTKLFDFNVGAKLFYATTEQQSQHSEVYKAKIRFGANGQLNDQFSYTLEYDVSDDLFEGQYYDGVNDNGKLLILAPDNQQFHQAKINWQNSLWKASIGRFQLSLDDKAMVSDFDFWPVQQSFDGASIERQFATQSTFRYFYLEQLNRVYGSEADLRLRDDDWRFSALNGVRPSRWLGKQGIDAHVIHWRYEEFELFKWSAYYININGLASQQENSKTLGLRTEFSYKPASIQYRLTVDAAVQKQHVNLANEKVNYILLDGQIGIEKLKLSAKFERFGAAENTYFTTPLAYVQDYHGPGWLYATSPNGLERRAIEAQYRARPLIFSLSLSHFDRARCEQCVRSIGKQWLGTMTYRVDRQHDLSLIVSSFLTDNIGYSSSGDIDKLWLVYNYNL